MTTTRLQRELAEGAGDRRPTPLDAFKLARRRFLAAERIDMSALADELQINRVTLYRWVGSRERLLVEVLWSLGHAALERDAWRRASGRRADRQIVRLPGDVSPTAGCSGCSPRRASSRCGCSPGRHRLPAAAHRRRRGLLRRRPARAASSCRPTSATSPTCSCALVESYAHLDLISASGPTRGAPSRSCACSCADPPPCPSTRRSSGCSPHWTRTDTAAWPAAARRRRAGRRSGR